ncbi:MAG: hypothetical protein IJV31_00030 [Clostridia bacterium]|nr:hypothetical protein [Clostridia bacterium]
MKVLTEYNERQPEFKYMDKHDGTADVFINKFIEEKTNEEDGSTSFIYEKNEFTVNTNEITEEMISENPMNYLDYPPKKIEITLEQRVSDLEAMWLEELLGGDEE